MYNKAQLSKDRKLAKEPKKLARPKDKFVIPGAPKVDPNGYWDPANVGRIIEVPLNEDSRSITMSYPDGTPLDQPLIGVGTDTGMMQYMMPGQDYMFPYDSSVMEHPIMDDGAYMDLDDDEIALYRAGGYVIEELPQQDNGGVYSKDLQYPNKRNPANSFTVTDPRSMQDGGDYEIELTDEEIDQYRKGGYVVEELPQAQKGKTVKPFVTSDPYEFKLREAAYNDSLWLYKNNLTTPIKHEPHKFNNLFGQYDSKQGPYSSKVISSSKPNSNYAKPTLEWKGGYDPQNPLMYYSSPAIKAGQNKSPFFIPGVPANKPIKYEHRESRWKPHASKSLLSGKIEQFYLPWEDRRDDDVQNTMDYARFKKPVQPVVFQSKTGSSSKSKTKSKNTSTSNKSYSEKNPIYVSDPNDPRIGWYTEAGNQFLYKEPTKAKPVQSKPEVGKLETKKLPQVETPEIIPSNYSYTPQEPETIRTASRSQTVMEPDPNREGKFKVKELREVPYSANFPGEGWLPMNAPQVIYYNPTTGEETEERFREGGLTQAQEGLQQPIIDKAQDEAETYAYAKAADKERWKELMDNTKALMDTAQGRKLWYQDLKPKNFSIDELQRFTQGVKEYNKGAQDYERARRKAQEDKISGDDFARMYKEKGWAKYDQDTMKEGYQGQFQDAADEAQKRKEANMVVTDTALELITGAPALFSIAQDPWGTVKGVGNTIADLALSANPGIGAAFGAGDPNVNPLTGNQYWSGLNQTLDVASILPGIGALGKLGKQPLIKGSQKLVKSLPQYENVYRVEPTSFTKDVSDELSGRWFGPAKDMEFYIKNSKDPNAGTRIIKTRIPTKKWESLSGFNLPENAKAMSAGTGNYKTYMDAANAGELSLGAAKRLSKGVQIASDVEELANNPRLINLNEGILPESTVDMIRKNKSKTIFPKTKTVEYPAGDLGTKDAFMHYLMEANKTENPIMGIPRKYLPFERGGYVANQMTHFQDGGNMDPGNNALELHMFYDKNNFATGGTVEMMTDDEIQKYRDAGYVIIEEPDYE